LTCGSAGFAATGVGTRRGRGRSVRRGRRRGHGIGREFVGDSHAGGDLARSLRDEVGRLADQGRDARGGLLGDARDQALHLVGIVLGRRPCLHGRRLVGARLATDAPVDLDLDRHAGIARAHHAVDLDGRFRWCDGGIDAVGLEFESQRRRDPLAHLRRHVARRADRDLDLVADLASVRNLRGIVFERPGRSTARREGEQAEQHHNMAHVAITPSRQQAIRMMK
jgi:hypothetical protein